KEIAANLANYPELPASEQRPCLFTGRMGEALFLMNYAQYLKNDFYFELAIQRVEESFELVNNGYPYLHFSGGLTGIFWAIEHFIELGYLEENTRKSLQPFDKHLAEKMLEDMTKGGFDFMHNALGIAFYLLKRRKHNPRLDAYLVKCVKALSDCALQADGGSLKWLSLLNSTTGETGPNICLSHGMSSIAIMLTKFIEHGIAKELSADLLHRTVSYILAQEIDSAQYLSYFPSMSLEKPNLSTLTSRMAWCYGDLGVGLALCRAGKTTGIPSWSEKGMEVLTFSCSRKEQFQDAGICHGTAGVAHIFQRIFHDTGLPVFKDTAAYWYKQTLTMGNNPVGLAGYLPYFVNEAVHLTQARGFLVGISGIGLSLLHAVSDTPPNWDECLLLS
ncbi:MAG: lanthionine synthetase C family protein, partial [Saprospiraceae bacterium]